MKAAGIIFDLDGTILDSMGIWSEIGSNYIRSLGLEPREALREDTRELSLNQASEYLKNSYSLIDSTDAIMDSINEMISEYYYNHLQPKEGARELLDYLKDKDLPLCVASATATHLVEAALKRIDMLDYFESIHSCVELGKGKDEPDIFFKAQESLGSQIKDTWVFEDALYAAKTAKAAGFTVVGVHDLSAQHHQEELKAISDYYIESLTEGKDLFE